VNLLSSLDKADAELFRKFCAFAWQIRVVFPLVYDHREKIYVDNGIFFESLKRLEEIGVVSFAPPPSGYQVERLPRTQVTFYYDKSFEVEFPKPEDNALPVASVLLTQAGKELGAICGSASCPGFDEDVMAKWQALRLRVMK
jgi:hypothetical protein